MLFDPTRLARGLSAADVAEVLSDLGVDRSEHLLKLKPRRLETLAELLKPVHETTFMELMLQPSSGPVSAAPVNSVTSHLAAASLNAVCVSVHTCHSCHRSTDSVLHFCGVGS